MIESSRLKRILTLALPVIGGMISQNVLNLVDTAMVGTLGNAALAAVGLGGFAAFMGQALLIGVSTGVLAMTARRKGEGNFKEMAAPLNTGLLTVLVFGIFLTTLLYFLIPEIYPFLNADVEVQNLGIPYLRYRILAAVFVGMNFSFRGYWNAVDLPKLYMSTLVVMHISNIILNYALIFGNLGAPKLGVSGAAIGTSISTIIGTLVYFYHGFKIARSNGFLVRLPYKEEIKSLVKLSIPNSLQQLFFSAGFTALYWIIGKVGTVELAAANVLINLILICILPGLGLGITAATLVGQALGRKEPEDAMRWGWDVTRIGTIGIFIIGLPLAIFPEFFLSIFIHDPITLSVAKLPIQISGLTIFLDVAGLILMNSLLGAGDSKTVMYISVGLQWVVFLPTAYIVGPILGYGLYHLWILQCSYRLIQFVIFAALWRRGTWKSIKI